MEPGRSEADDLVPRGGDQRAWVGASYPEESDSGAGKAEMGGSALETKSARQQAKVSF